MTPALPLSLPGWILLPCGIVALATPWLTLLLSMLLVGGGRGPRTRRGGAPFLKVAAGVLVLTALSRAVGWSAGAPGGPEGWIDAINAAIKQPGSGFWGRLVTLTGLTVQLNPLRADLVFPIAAILGLSTLPTGFVVALMERNDAEAPDYRVPFGGHVALVTLLSTVLGTCLLYGHYADTQPRLLLDAVATAPTVLSCLAIWALSGRETPAAVAAKEAPAPPAARERGDIVQRWKDVGALAAEAKAIFQQDQARAEGGSRVAADAWSHVGGHGPPPESLDQLRELMRKDRGAWVVGDLPAPTEALFVTAMLMLAAQDQGLACLVITDEARDQRDRFQAAVRAAGAWAYGPITAGTDELKRALGDACMPAVAFLSVNELSSEGIGALWSCMEPRPGNTPWTRTLGLVVISRLDRGSPLQVTHRYFALRRLTLALASASASYSVLATGFGGTGTRRFVEYAFPALRPTEVPIGLRANAPVKVWSANAPFVGRAGEPWPRRAAGPLVTELRLAVSVGDPAGHFDETVGIWAGDVTLSRDVTLDGAASISQLGDGWLVAAWRSLPNRVPLADGSVHHALWAWDDSPVTTYLVGGDTLRSLQHHGQLPTPRALVGAANPHLARAHLQAAMREGRQDRASLAAIFGSSLAESELRHTDGAAGHVLRRLPAGEKLIRVETVPPLPGALTEVLRETVTGQEVAVLDAAGGRRLLRCDEQNAVTRFYPHRVFASANARFRVPQHSYDPARRELRVESVDATQPLTRPDLRIQVLSASVVDAPQHYTAGPREFTYASYDVRVRERVLGAFLHQGHIRLDTPVEVEYPTRARLIAFKAAATANTLFHLASCVDRVALAHLLAEDDDIHVMDVQAGVFPGQGGGIVAIDRYVGGMGVAEALDVHAIDTMLRWVAELLFRCPCRRGCEACTPAEVIKAGPDKQGVLSLLGR